jgi:hypothetical protein
MNSADRIYHELVQQVVGIWYISDDFGSKIMVKIPSTAIKSLISGCKMDFLFGKDEQNIFPFFHAGLRIFDDPVHFMRMTSILRFTQEHKALRKIMAMETVNIHFHNELTVCMATATLTIDQTHRNQILALLGDAEQLYSGNYNKLVDHSLNCFDYSVSKKGTTSEALRKIDVLFIDSLLSNWIIMNNTFIGFNERNKLNITDNDEGDLLEKQTWAVLESVFLTSLYRQPRINDKQGFRELTDVLAYHEYGCFLFETKALSVLNLEKERNMDRKVSGLKKQIAKGIDQMKGTAKKVASGVVIYDQKGGVIDFDRTIVPHCIVLVSELLPFGNWTEIENKMISAMKEQRMCLNVMDLRELTTYIALSQGNKNRLDASLLDRVKQFVQFKDIHMRVAIQKQEDEE